MESSIGPHSEEVCVCDVVGFTLDPVGHQKRSNIYKKWNDVIGFV